MKAFYRFLLFFVVAVFLVSACGGSDGRNGAVSSEDQTDVSVAATGDADTPEDAFAMDDGVTEGELGVDDEQDWFVFPVAGGEVIDLVVAPGADADAINFQLLDENQGVLWSEWDVSAPVTKELTLATASGVDGNFFVKVFPGRPGSYTLELSRRMQDDAGSATDASDRAAEAVEIPVGEAVLGEIGDFDEKDFFSFDVPDGVLLTLQFTPGDDAGDMNIELFDRELNGLWQAWDVHPGITSTGTVILNSSSGGTYYAAVSMGHGGSYTLLVDPVSQDDAASGTDAGDRAVNALPVEVGQTVSGVLGDYDEEDWYTFVPQDGSTLTVSVTPGEDCAALNVELFDPELNALDENWDVPAGLTTAIELTPASEAGTYYLKLSKGRNGSYSFVIE